MRAPWVLAWRRLGLGDFLANVMRHPTTRPNAAFSIYFRVNSAFDPEDAFVMVLGGRFPRVPGSFRVRRPETMAATLRIGGTLQNATPDS